MRKLLICITFYSALLHFVVQACLAQAPAAALKPSVTPTTLERPDVVATYEDTITGEELAAHLYLFASDYFEGRRSATRGQKLASYYLASEYQRLGLKPMGRPPEGTQNVLARFMQSFPVYSEQLQRADLAARSGNEVIAETVFSGDAADGQSYLISGTVPDVSGPVIFAGYGIADSEYRYDDFDAVKRAGLDPSSGWLMILRDEPLEDAQTSLFATADGRPSEWTDQPALKYLSIHREMQPRGILVVGDAGPRADRPFAGVVRDNALRLNTVKDLTLTDELSQVSYLPIYVVSSDFADKLLRPSGRTVEELRRRINAKLTPIVFAVPDVVLTSRIARGNVRLQTENVIAMVEGTDPRLKDEFVVISSHYDHIGLTDGSDGDFVNNGADDDGSGTVAGLEMAEAFQKAKEAGYGPRRSVLFVNFSGEEEGLLGSEYFADVDPVVPLQNIVTDLNVDMIGRVDPTYGGETQDYVYLIGSRLISEELHEIATRVNVATGRNLVLDERFNSRSDPNRFYARSDHWNFGKHGIPFIFFFTGTHEDYHQPGDEPHKILYDRLANITKLIFATAWQLANQDGRPAVSGKGFN